MSDHTNGHAVGNRALSCFPGRVEAIKKLALRDAENKMRAEPISVNRAVLQFMFQKIFAACPC
jgi:hypothetical protein